MTTEELIALPEDHIDRWLLRGAPRACLRRLRMPGEAAAITNVASALSRWVRDAKSERGAVLIDAWHRLARDPDTTLAIDVVLVGKGKLARGPPRAVRRWRADGGGDHPLAGQSPPGAAGRDRRADRLGVPLVWLVNADFETVSVIAAGAGSSLLAREQTLTGEPHLPGFAVPVAELFA